MQPECSDEPLACSVGLQSTPSSVVRATVGDTRLVTSMGRVSERRLRRVGVLAGARLDGQVQLRGQPLSFADYVRDPTFSRGLLHVVEGSGRNGSRPNRRRAYGEAGIANT